MIFVVYRDFSQALFLLDTWAGSPSLCQPLVVPLSLARSQLGLPTVANETLDRSYAGRLLIMSLILFSMHAGLSDHALSSFPSLRNFLWTGNEKRGHSNKVAWDRHRLSIDQKRKKA